MRKKNFKGRCEKRSLSKCHDVCRTYDPIQYAYADVLQADDDIAEIRCNALLDGLELGEFTTDFVCVKTNGDLMVRECVSRNHLTKPLTITSGTTDHLSETACKNLHRLSGLECWIPPYLIIISRIIRMIIRIIRSPNI